MLSPSSPIHAAFFLKPTWYTLCPLPALSSPAFDYNQLLEFLHALHLQGLHAAPIDFNTTLRHCQKHLSLNGNQVRGIFDSLVLLNDQGASQISATTLLILLFGQLSHQSASATGSEEDEDYDALESSYSDSFQDCYVTYAQQATFWKSHFKEFLCALSLLFDGPEAIQKASQVGDKLSLSVSFAKDVIDQLFIGLPTESSSEVVESFESWTEHRETNRTAFSLTASETKPVSEWMTAINKKQKEGSSERVDFAFLQDFVEWGLGVESPMLCSPSFTRHGLSQGLQNDIPGFPGK